MNVWLAILLTLALIVAGSVLKISWLLIILTSLWVAIDSKKIQIRNYQNGLRNGPVALFLLCVLLWVIIFPWYLSIRGKIKKGALPLHDGSRQRLVNPWAWWALGITIGFPVMVISGLVLYGQLFGAH